ncbi:hypothetical protein [Candidatus Carsonella ruddii]|uniref:hypothetical protein n=1 Tax=Carsonella ruddii TaxID=114186 RepID=UPI003D412807
MNFNFTLINEFISFIFFFFFSCFFIFPFIIKLLNNFSLIDFKNKSFIKFNQTLENKLIRYLFLIESELKNKTDIILDLMNNIFYKKKDNLSYLISVEKKKIFIEINKLFKSEQIKMIKKFFNSVKLSFVRSFKNVYNEILNYNNEYIINYD